MYFLWVRVVQFIFLSKQKQVKPQRKCIVKESCNSCSLQGLGANMAEAESSTDQRMLRGGGGVMFEEDTFAAQLLTMTL